MRGGRADVVPDRWLRFWGDRRGGDRRRSHGRTCRHRRGRAARAAERLNVRLGVASGLVVVGDLISAGAAQERGVVGETPNLARRQALAQPGTGKPAGAGEIKGEAGRRCSG